MAAASSEKNRDCFHPLVSFVIHYSIASAVSFGIHDLLVGKDESWCELAATPNDEYTRQCVSLFVAIYALWLLIWRLFTNNSNCSAVIYEYTWLCNVTLVLGAVAIYVHRPIVATAHAIAVGIDQLMWYVDLTGWIVSGFTKFPIGVAKYLTWPGTSWWTRITCTHHLWTIPLFVTVAGGVHVLAFPLSVVIIVTNVLLSRWLTPFCTTKYLNVNLSHELWRDIKIDVLQINYDDPLVATYLFRLLWRWSGFNLLVFGALFTLSKAVFGPAPVY